MNTKRLSLISIYSALFVSLEVVSLFVPIFKMPNGGSISLSVIAIILASYHMDWKAALTVSGIGLIVSFMINPPYILTFLQFTLDYILAFSVYSFASIFKTWTTKKAFVFSLGTLITNILRFIFHNIAGWLFFGDSFQGNVLLGVSIYNATYMIPTCIISILCVGFMIPRLKKQLD